MTPSFACSVEVDSSSLRRGELAVAALVCRHASACAHALHTPSPLVSNYVTHSYHSVVLNRSRHLDAFPSGSTPRCVSLRDHVRLATQVDGVITSSHAHDVIDHATTHSLHHQLHHHSSLTPSLRHSVTNSPMTSSLLSFTRSAFSTPSLRTHASQNVVTNLSSKTLTKTVSIQTFFCLKNVTCF